MESQVTRNEALLADAERILTRQSELRSRGFAAEATAETARATRDAQAAALNSARAQVNSAKAALLGLAADLQVAQANLEAGSAQILQREGRCARSRSICRIGNQVAGQRRGGSAQCRIGRHRRCVAAGTDPVPDRRRSRAYGNRRQYRRNRCRPHQGRSEAIFTVNAFPGRSFEGQVKMVRIGSQNVQNVEIYTTIISIENPRRELRRHDRQSAGRDERRDNVVRIPNAALRWRPASLADSPSSERPAHRVDPAAAAEAQRRPQGGNNSAELIDAIKKELHLSSVQSKDVDALVAEMRQAMIANAVPAATQCETRAAFAPRARSLRDDCRHSDRRAEAAVSGDR